MTKISGWPGTVRSGSTRTLPPRSSLAPVASAMTLPKKEASTPAAQITVEQRMVSSLSARFTVTTFELTSVTGVNSKVVTVKRADKLETIRCSTVIWAAGVEASFLGKVIADATGAKLDRGGRVLVEPDLTV